MSTAVDASSFREHRTLDECKLLLHYGHVIPICHGHTARFVAVHYPGWTWNELVAVFKAAGIFINRGGAPATCDDRVVRFHFSGPTEFYVEWIDGVEPDDVAAKRRAARCATSVRRSRAPGEDVIAGGVGSG